VDKYVNLFTVLALQESTIIGANPYLIACAIIAAARKSSGIMRAKVQDRIWPPELA
jgi:hypothetical protein